jgi:NAD(P)-dependent dehydrogenase (short-subunit alcohol dehydrogenase family)
MATSGGTANKLAVVTGADLGIGRAVSTVLARNGYDLIITARSHERLLGVRDELYHTQSQITIVPADISVEGQRDEILRAAEADDRGLSALISCASAQIDPETESLLADIEPGRIDEIFAVTAIGAIHLLRECKPLLSRAQPSHAIFLGSDWALPGSHGPVIFSAAKAALAQAIRTARREFARAGISLSVLLPGDIASYDVDWSEPVWSIDDPVDKIYNAMGNSRIPLIDIAETILFILQRSMMRVDELILSPLDPDYDY